MMLSVTFFRPKDYFSSAFNRLATWMTAGEFCHCDLVVHTTPAEVMDVVKEIYASAQSREYAPGDCERILHQIESNFFGVQFRDVAQKSETITLAFAALWGSPMTVRVLTPVSHDSWYQIPNETTGISEIKVVEGITKEQSLKTLKFGIEELGKAYDVSGALCSWLPWSISKPQQQYESYFCSEFCVTACQRLGFMKTLSPLHTTPNALYDFMNSN